MHTVILFRKQHEQARPWHHFLPSYTRTNSRNLYLSVRYSSNGAEGSSPLSQAAENFGSSSFLKVQHTSCLFIFPVALGPIFT
jgi:hypothetical protein